MRLRSKRFFMRAAARLPFLHENKLFSLFPVFRERQRDPGADIQGAVERERRAVQGRAVFDDRQTETGAAGHFAVALVHAVEALENTLLVGRGDADAGIRDADEGGAVAVLSLIHILTLPTN